MMKKIILLTVAVLTFLGCSKKEATLDDSLKVATTTFAVYDAAKYVGGEFFEVYMIIPPGKEIHTFEPTPKEIVKLKKSVLVFYNGAGLEPWAKQFVLATQGVDLSQYVVLQKMGHSHQHAHTHTHLGGVDPHYWLDIDNMKKITDVIAQRFSALKQKQKTYFVNRASEYKAMLDSLDENFKKHLHTCKKKEIFVNHNAYSYLARRYGFMVDSLVGLSPEAQPSPKKVESILEAIKKEDAKVVFVESFENASVLKSIANEKGITVDTLYPLANITAQQAKEDASYHSLMLQNLDKLKKALECNEF
jgi:zinc transport system substrate-binding protein